MGRAAGGVACLVLLGGLVTGCSTESEIDRWIESESRRVDAESERSGADSEGLTGLVTATVRPVSPGDPPGGAGQDGVLPYDTGDGTVTEVQLSCVGNDTMTFYLERDFDIDGPSRGDGVEVEVTCADDPHTEAVDTQGTDSLGIGIPGVEHEGAWSALLLAG